MAAQTSSHPKSSHDSQHHFLGTVKQKTTPFQHFITKFNNDWSMNFAGLLAYNLLTAISPIAIALFGILGLILTQNNALVQGLLTQIPKLFAAKTQQDAISGFLTGALSQIRKDSLILVILAIVLALFGGSRLFITMEGCLDLIYRVRPRTIIKQNIMAFLMLLLFIVLIPIMFLTSTAPTFILGFLNNQPQLKSIPFFSAFASSFITTYLAATATSVLVSFILFEAIYSVVPNQKISFRNSWRGALAAAVLLVLFLQLFPLYTSNFLKGYSGTIGLAVIILLFFYYFAVILILGAQVNAFFFEHVQPIPNDLITFVSTMAGKLNKDRPSAEDEPHVDPKATNEKDRGHVLEESDRIEDEENKKKPAQDASQQKQSETQNHASEQKQPSDQPQSAQKQVTTQSSSHQQVQTAKGGGPSKGITALSVVLGSALTVVVETLRLRHHSK